MKKTIIIIFIFIFILFMNLNARNIKLKLYVIPFENDSSKCDLKKDDLILKVNNDIVNIEILKVMKREPAKEEKRNFVLDFSISDCSEQIYEPLKFFVNNVLKADDLLILKTPMKLYKIKITGTKDDVIDNIKNLLRKDVMKYKTNRKNYLKFLMKDNPGETPTEIMNFLNKYKREWENYRDMFILPNYKSIANICGILANGNGEKYYIKFQEREIMPFMVSFNKIKNSIRTTLTTYTGNYQSYSASISSNLSVIEKSLLVSEKININLIKNLLLGVNISYNVLLFKSARLNTRIGEVSSPDYEKYLKELSLSTGGIFIINCDLIEGIKRIIKNKSCYYEMVFEVDDKEEEKNIEIILKKGKFKLSYKNKLYKENIMMIKKILSQPTVKIDKYGFKNNRLNFRIKDFVMKDKVGVVFVEIKILDKSKNVVFKTGKTLKAKQKEIKISIPLPEKLKGYLNIKVYARDEYTGKDFEISEYEKF